MFHKILPYIRRFQQYFSLLRELVARDLKVKYRRTFLGYLWSVVNPLLTMLVLAAVFSLLFTRNIEYYPAYLICGQVVYNFFSQSTQQAMNAISGNGSLIKKVRIPKYILPLAKTVSSFINTLLSLLAVFIVMTVTGVPFNWTVILSVFPLLYLMLISTGMGMILAILATYFKDVSYIYSVFLTMLMYATPIFYPEDILPESIGVVMTFNPLRHVVIMFRYCMIYGEIPSAREHLYCIGFSVISMGLGLLIFKKYQDRLVFKL